MENIIFFILYKYISKEEWGEEGELTLVSKAKLKVWS